MGTVGSSRSLEPGRRRWWPVLPGLAVCVIALAVLVQVLRPSGHRASRASVATIRANALATYTAMRPAVEAESVYLATRPVLAFTRDVAHGGQVSFPSGTVLKAPAGGAWTVSVGAAADPTDPTRQVNMLFAPSGALIRALPAEIPGGVVSGGPAPSTSQLPGLKWRDASVLTTEIPRCSGPACATGRDIPRRYAHTRLTIETAPFHGATIVAVNAQHMRPDTPNYLETTAGIVGSAKTSPAGALVAVFVIPANAARRAEAARGHGIAVLNGNGWELIQACLFGGDVTNLTRYATCR
jgi:hypothetical protein